MATVSNSNTNRVVATALWFYLLGYSRWACFITVNPQKARVRGNAQKETQVFYTKSHSNCLEERLLVKIKTDNTFLYVMTTQCTEQIRYARCWPRGNERQMVRQKTSLISQKTDMKEISLLSLLSEHASENKEIKSNWSMRRDSLEGG